MKKKHLIDLDPNNKGKFTAKAGRAGMSDTEFAQKSLLSGSGASLQTRREAQFDINQKKFSRKRKR